MRRRGFRTSSARSNICVNQQQPLPGKTGGGCFLSADIFREVGDTLPWGIFPRAQWGYSLIKHSPRGGAYCTCSPRAASAVTLRAAPTPALRTDVILRQASPHIRNSPHTSTPLRHPRSPVNIPRTAKRTLPVGYSSRAGSLLRKKQTPGQRRRLVCLYGKIFADGCVSAS